MMKQSEKLDRILRYLYDNKTFPAHYSTKDICEELNVPIDDVEAWQLGKRLVDDRLVNGSGTFDDMLIQINSYGIEYVEEDSFSKHGTPISPTINNFYVTNSANTAIVNSSENVHVNQTNKDVNAVISKILQGLEWEKIPNELKEEIKECVVEVQTSLKNGIKPKFAFKSLVALTADFTTIATFVLELGKLTGLIS